MPSLAAALAATAAGWIVDGLLERSFGWGVTMILSFVVSVAVFFAARKWLIDLREGRL